MPLRFTKRPFNGNLLVDLVGRVTVFNATIFAGADI